MRRAVGLPVLSQRPRDVISLRPVYEGHGLTHPRPLGCDVITSGVRQTRTLHCFPPAGRLFLKRWACCFAALLPSLLAWTMPFACVAPGCNGNYRKGPKVTVFGFPEKPELRDRWLQAIKREHFSPTKCSKVN